jgi:hypothetical protein
MKTLLFILTFFNVFFSFAQNLVPNSGFELTETVPCGWSNSNTIFDNAIVDWNSPSFGTPDILSTLITQDCWNYQPNSSYLGPGCATGFQVPHSGNNFAGFYTYTPSISQREYLQVKLSTPMVPGNLYYVKLYVSLADNAKFMTNNIGVGFSTSSTFASIGGPLAYVPQINFTDTISDQTNWVLLMDSIIPEAAFEYIIIGNFFNDATTNVVTDFGCTNGAYYYCDDVCVSTDYNTCNSGVGINELTTPEKKLLRIVDIMGREIQHQSNTMLIYVFSDGSTQKVFNVE